MGNGRRDRGQGKPRGGGVKQTMMLPDILGRTKFESGGDSRVLDIMYADSGTWILRLSYFRPKEKEPYRKDALVLYTTELDELTRWWSEVKKAVK